MKKVVLIIFLYIFQQGFAQNVCIAKAETSYEDLNQISVNKCTEDVSKSVKKEISDKRYFKRRQLKKAAIKKNKDSSEITKLNLVKTNVANVIASIKKEIKTIPFLKVEKTPLFPSTKENNSSFNEMMSNHIQNTLKYPKEALYNEIEGVVLVDFIIDTDGKVSEINVASTDDKNNVLQKEAKRIVSLLPKFTPAKHNGEKVKVFYSFPMEFSLN